MTKSVLLLLLGVVLVCAVETVNEPVGDQLPVSSSVRSLSLPSLLGKWYQTALSQEVRNIFQMDCQCLVSSFKTLINKNKLLISNECLNKTTNKIVSVDLTLSQVMAETNPGAFHIDMKSENEGGAGVVEGQNESKIKEDMSKIVDINFLVLKNVENKALLIGGPSNELIWALSRTTILDEPIFRSFNDEAKRLGYHSLVKADPCSS